MMLNRDVLSWQSPQLYGAFNVFKLAVERAGPWEWDLEPGKLCTEGQATVVFDNAYMGLQVLARLDSGPCIRLLILFRRTSTLALLCACYGSNSLSVLVGE